MNQFGGDWTSRKMEIVVNYAKAYLKIMANQPWARTIYFDGFAGSGIITNEDGGNHMKGTALRILDIIEPKPFDLYYFVEKNPEFSRSLNEYIVEHYEYQSQFAHVVSDDCNTKLKSMAAFLKGNSEYRALAFVDPYGMDVEWTAIESLKEGLGVDLWILVPTGIGPNRLLKLDGEISEGWYKRLEKFLGLSRKEINDRFYKRTSTPTLFGEDITTKKLDNAVEKLAQLYADRLNEIFDHVSKPFIMKNSTNSPMYHFMMATNNKSAAKIANDLVKTKRRL